ncbi:glycosyltransferase family 1 protein [Agromyces sp. NPDC058126]|uniref:glycosyltransferase family 1 protein n=1 Tax=Agromyces sp. NPDC058126 TaxID=3346350 RepID=UPI0036D8F833
MKLLIISFSTLVSDPRVRKQIDLFTGEFEVTTVGYGPKPPGASAHHQIPDDRVAWRYPRPAVMARAYRWAFEHNPAVSWVLENVRPGGAEVIVANDVDAAGVAVRLAPSRGFHSDLHEFAPEQNSEMLRFRLFVAPFLRWQLRRYVARAASTTTVCATIADRYRGEFGLDASVVMNAPPFAELEPSPVGAPIRLVHAGAALRNRRLEVLVDAVASRTDVTLDLYLTPNDPAYREELVARAAATPGVRVVDPVPFDTLVTTLNAYDVGLHMLAPTNFNNAYALPNKFFEYVQARLGLIIGPSPEMMRVMGPRGFGTAAADFTADALAAELDGLTAERVRQWKSAAHAAARELSAEHQVPVWRSAVEAIAGERA